jgi:penicillin-binding protein 1C
MPDNRQNCLKRLMKSGSIFTLVKIIGILTGVMLLLLILGRLFLPKPVFSDPYSTVLFDKQQNLLGARVAADGQWRFSESDSIPVKYEKALIQFEDKYFYNHFGFNPVSFINAMVDNLKAGHIVRGGSTISMQVIRMARKGKPRTITEKVIEIWLAIALESKYTKKEILNLYASHAPFGGNVVGLEAASWRYFERKPFNLSWAEAALLAVLPNAPSLIHPGKNRAVLLKKRNILLKALWKAGKIDETAYRLSLLEEIPDKPHRLPDNASHLLEYYRKQQTNEKILTTIDGYLQSQVNDVVREYYKKYNENEIHNLAVLVVNPETKEVLSYVGNVSGKVSHGEANDMIRAPRSTGSILKPLLYVAAIDDGQIILNSLIPDIPSYFRNYHPQNFDQVFEGSVPASKALSRSRNVPAIYLLRDYGIGKFMDKMKQLGITSFNRSSDYYGLSLILGGGEATLWELTAAYAGMAQTLLHYDAFYGKYTGDEYGQLISESNQVVNQKEPKTSASLPLHAGAIWQAYQALYQVHRPKMEEGWEYFNARVPIAWKTGTSFGFKDGWAIGTTPEYVVGVWVGNADGEGRPGLTGTSYAAPVMFEVFNLLHPNKKFQRPEDDLKEIVVCKQSGYRASRYCPDTDTVLSYVAGERVKTCPYHKLVFTDKEEEYRLSGKCASVQEMKKVSWFVLPPVQEYYFKKAHPSYKMLPPYKQGCSPENENSIMEFIYPKSGIKIFVPRDADGKKKEVIFQVSHQNSRVLLYWHLDNKYIGSTKDLHQLAFIPEPGYHTLIVIDENGVSKKIRFEVVE